MLLEFVVALLGATIFFFYIGSNYRKREQKWFYALYFGAALLCLFALFGLLIVASTSGESSLGVNETVSLESNDMCSLFSDCNFTSSSNCSVSNATAGGVNESVQFNYNGGFGGSPAIKWYDLLHKLVISNRSVFGEQLVVEGFYGNTSFTGNNIYMTRAGANYISASDALGSLYFGAGGATGVLSLFTGALTNTVRVGGEGVGIYADADEFELTVNGAILAYENVTSPLVVADCINLAGEEVCSWAAVNGSSGGGSEVYNGTFNETEGFYIYNSTPFLINFNETLLNSTIDSRGDNYLLTDGSRTLNGNLNMTGNITNTANASWGYYNNGSCIVIGNLYYISEC